MLRPLANNTTQPFPARQRHRHTRHHTVRLLSPHAHREEKSKYLRVVSERREGYDEHTCNERERKIKTLYLSLPSDAQASKMCVGARP